MNAENFSDYIDNPKLLYQMNYQELKQLILAYPFCANLRYLIAKKAQQEQHLDLAKNLRLAAVHSPDRKRLFNYLLSEEKETVKSFQDEMLELKPLNELELKPIDPLFAAPVKEIIPEKPTLQFNVEEASASVSEQVPSATSLETTFDFETETLQQNLDNTTNIIALNQHQATTEIEFSVSEEEEIESTNPAEEEEQLGAINKTSRRRNRYRKPSVSFKSTELAKEVVDKNIPQNQLESLTLLNLSKELQQTLEVYEQLSLIFPEKSNFFAQKIENIRSSAE